MAKNEKKTRKSKFRTGTHGGCEALLYEFREQPSDSVDCPRTLTMGSRVVLVAAETFDEAFSYLRFDSPDFDIHTVTCLGLILMASGSPTD